MSVLEGLLSRNNRHRTAGVRQKQLVRVRLAVPADASENRGRCCLTWSRSLGKWTPLMKLG
jgi:hypothetical protein